MEKIKSFVVRNNVFFVGFGGLAFMHWVWYRIQYNDAFVEEHERKPFPLIHMFQVFKEKLVDNKEIGTIKPVENVKR